MYTLTHVGHFIFLVIARNGKGQTVSSIILVLVLNIGIEYIDIVFNQVCPTLKFNPVPCTSRHFDFMQLKHRLLVY